MTCCSHHRPSSGLPIISQSDVAWHTDSAMYPHCRQAFDELTECSTRLLDSGDYNAHSNTREQLQMDLTSRQAQHQEAADLDMFAMGDEVISPEAVQQVRCCSVSPEPACKGPHSLLLPDLHCLALTGCRFLILCSICAHLC